MKKIIIGIHGLANKPPRRTLKKWWEKAIYEGLRGIGERKNYFKFELVYWTHLTHPKPLNVKITDRKHPLYLQEPYVPSTGKKKSWKLKWLKRKILDSIEKRIDKLFFDEKSIINFDAFANSIMRKIFADLYLYYNKEITWGRYAHMSVKEKIREELARMLKKYRRHKILLIAHSMGSIVAYDVLTQVTQRIPVDTFVTIGSPLGLPVIMKKIFIEQGTTYKKEKKAPSPENITKHWYNFSDLDDKVAVNYNLADDYRENTKGIGPDDYIVQNDYKYEKKKNDHKIYGYLRTPEMAIVISGFLCKKRPVIIDKIIGLFRLLMGKIREIFRIEF
ncbi:esterase/lipase family protein [Spirochaetota bacterium]